MLLDSLAQLGLPVLPGSLDQLERQVLQGLPAQPDSPARLDSLDQLERQVLQGSRVQREPRAL